VPYRETRHPAERHRRRIRVVPNKFPELKGEAEYEQRGDGIYDKLLGAALKK